MLKLGSTDINKAYLGATEINKIYLGADEVFSGGVVPFDPSQIPDLALWLDASDAATITQVAGAVSQWNDKSGNGYNATQATGANQPVTGSRTINGRNVIDFDGSVQRMELPSGLYSLSTGASTFFLVYAHDVPSATSRIVSGSNGNARYGISVNLGTTNRVQFGSTTTSSNGSNAGLTRTLNSDPSIAIGKRSGSPQNVWDNLGNTGSNSSGGDFTMNSFVLGRFPTGGWEYDGVMAEIVIYNAALSSSDINLVGAYLAAKWGTPWTNI